ncbi:hypothetical protein B6D29_02435 [Microgenomates bacterium UTCPR1]|nr:hypothetical protein [Patescibacteria group bacterium]OQY66913.1 MAG: hypothetical protein B6D29_02435 [Microgenomates bacterium UTCPR1]
MKKYFNLLIGITLISLIFINLLILYSTIRLGDEITLYEAKIDQIHRKNIGLEKDLSRLGSLSYARKIAIKLDFTKKAQPEFLEKVTYAFVPNK